MKSIQILGTVVLLFQLAAGGEVSRRSQYRRTLFSNSGEQGADIDAAVSSTKGAASSDNASSPNVAAAASPAVEMSPSESMSPETMSPESMSPAAGGEGMMPTAGEGEAMMPAAGEATAAGLTAQAATGMPAGAMPPGFPTGSAPAGFPPGAMAAGSGGAPPGFPPGGAMPPESPPTILIVASLVLGPAALQLPLDELVNLLFGYVLNAFFIGSIFILFIIRLGRKLIRYVRTLTSLTNPKQEYYYEPSESFAGVKKNLIDAPMFKHRRAQESRPHPKIHGGALPTRLQAIYLVVYLLLNVLLLVAFIPFTLGLPTALLASLIKNRAGSLALANIPPLIFIAGRQNPFISLVHVPFDTFNTMHRWFARMTVLLLFVHVGAWLVSVVSRAGFQSAVQAVKNVPFILVGYIAFITFFVILIQGSSPIRHAAYETFKILHILLVGVALAGTYFHLSLKGKPQLSTLTLSLTFWAVDRITRVISLLRANLGKKGSRAHVESLPGDAVKVTLELARPWKFVPGQHLYLYMPTIGFWQSHPFSIAWASTQTEDVYPTDKLLDNKIVDIKTITKTKFQLIIKQRGGFTKSLVQKAQKAPGGKFSTFAMAEGPFGGFEPLTSYGTVILFAGGVGITHMVPYIQQLVTCNSRHSASTKRIALIWVIPRPDALNWIAPWMQEILHIQGRRECLRLIIYITKLGQNEKIDSPSDTIQIFPGRPDIGALMDWECEPMNQIGKMGVCCCGGGALADDVRAAVRQRQKRSAMDYIEESFTW